MFAVACILAVYSLHQWSFHVDLYCSLQGDGGNSYSLNRLQQRQNTTERTLQNAVRGINGIADKLSLVQGVKDAAAYIFKDVSASFELFFNRLVHTLRCVGMTITRMKISHLKLKQ
jgi:hypothetical protein